MSKDVETEFLVVLKALQDSSNAYWIQTKHISRWLFGLTLNEREENTNRKRVYRLAKRLEKKGKIKKTKRMESIGESTGKITVQYYHTDLSIMEIHKIPLFEKLKQITRREKNGNK